MASVENTTNKIPILGKYWFYIGNICNKVQLLQKCYYYIGNVINSKYPNSCYSDRQISASILKNKKLPYKSFTLNMKNK